jgi:hypothetical protein
MLKFLRTVAGRRVLMQAIRLRREELARQRRMPPKEAEA